MKVTLIAELTADGFIAKDDAHLSTRWTSKEDSLFFLERAKHAGHMIVGSKTFATFNRQMKGRKMYVYSRSLEVENAYNNDIEVVSLAPKELIADLAKRGIEEVLITGGSSIYTLFMNAGVIDTLLLTHEPVIFGTGVTLFNEAVSAKLQLSLVHNLSDQTKVFEYEVMQ